MAKEVRKIFIDIEYPASPLHGEPTVGTSCAREIKAILEAGAAANGATITQFRPSGLLSSYCAELVFEVIET